MPQENEIEVGNPDTTTDFLPSGGATCSPSSDTPETDAISNAWIGDMMTPWNLARKLERERNSLKNTMTIDDGKWSSRFVLPIATEMKRRGIGEMRIKLTQNGTAVFDLIPENA